ncbi:MAG: universal stress protein [Hyphomicrobiales bacterium]
MPHTAIAYIPLTTYPEAVTDQAILAATRFAAMLGYELHVSVFSVDIPQVYAPLGGLLLDVPGLVRAAEEKSSAECQRLRNVLAGPREPQTRVTCSVRESLLGTTRDIAAAEARYYDCSFLPWSGETVAVQDISEAVIFNSGRPAILVPPSTRPDRLDHIAIAWDESRVAARALGDALSLLPKGGRVSVLTVRDEKPLSGPDIAALLATSLGRRGIEARSLLIDRGDRTIAEALQDTALAEGAQVLAMGGFGHSRMRDFVLGGATCGVLADARLPVLLVH